MLLRLLLNKRLCYGYSILPTLFNRIPVVIARQWNVATHGEVAAAGISVEEQDRSNESSKMMTNK